MGGVVMLLCFCFIHPCKSKNLLLLIFILIAREVSGEFPVWRPTADTLSVVGVLQSFEQNFRYHLFSGTV
jgi:hypothetical protein